MGWSGTQLLIAILEELILQEFSSVSLSVQKANRAHLLYQHSGFQVYQDKEELIMRNLLLSEDELCI